MKRLVLTILLLAFRCAAAEPLFFVQLTDTHFGQGDNLERVRTVVKAVNELPMKVAFVAVTGDIMNDCITDSNQVNEALAVLGQLKMPVHFVPGNHDLLTASLEETVAVFTNRFGPLISSAEYGGVQFIFVCTEPLSGGAQIPGYDPLGALDRLLRSRTNGQSAVVFHHQPAVDDFYHNRINAGWNRTAAGRRWVELMNQNKVTAVIAGHFHRDEFHWLEKVPLFVGPPLSGRLGRQAAFRIYEYRDDRLGYWNQYIE